MIDQGVLAWAGPSLTQVDNRCPRTREGHPGIITGPSLPCCFAITPKKKQNYLFLGPIEMWPSCGTISIRLIRAGCAGVGSHGCKDTFDVCATRTDSHLGSRHSCTPGKCRR